MFYMIAKDDLNVKIQSVKRAMRKNKSSRMHKRYMVILRNLQGYLNNEIAEMELLCANYINSYKKYGLDGLTMGYSTGAPRLLNDEQEKELIQTITNNTPDEVGFITREI